MNELGRWLVVLSLLVGLSPAVAVAQSVSSLERQLEESVGVRFARARELERQGRTREAIRILTQLERQLEKGPALVPVRGALARLGRNPGLLSRTNVAPNQGKPGRSGTTETDAPPLELFLSLEAKLVTHDKAKNTWATDKRRIVMRLLASEPFDRELRLRAGEATLILRVKSVGKDTATFSGMMTAGIVARKISTATMPLSGVGNEQRQFRMRIGESEASINLQIDRNRRSTPRNTVENKTRFRMRFTNASVAEILSHVAKLNGLKVTFSGDVSKQKKLSLKIKANTRMDVITRTCSEFGLRCEVRGGELHVTLGRPRPKK